MVRWLERNGYDVSYSTGVDTDRRGAEILEHEAFLSVGHDEYWSARPARQRRGGPRRRRQPRLLQRQRGLLEDPLGEQHRRLQHAHRTLVCYKETHANAKIDPTSTWTGTWRDPRFSPEGGQPENALTGTIFTVNSGTSAIEVPGGRRQAAPLAEHERRLARARADARRSADSTLGYEWDEDLDNGSRPPGLVAVLHHGRTGVERAPGLRLDLRPGTATHHLTLYRAPSGALVFGAGTSSGRGASTATTTAAARPRIRACSRRR